MTCQTKTSTSYLDASTVTIGKEHATCIHPVVGLVGGEYFEISDQTTEYYFWFTVNAVGTDPAIVGKTPVEIDLPTGYTVKQAIDAIVAEMAILKKFYSYKTVDNLGIVLETANIGAVISETVDGDTGFTFELVKTGASENLGDTQDGIEVSSEVTVLDVFSNQSPNTPKDQIYQGSTVSMTAAFLEVSKERLETILGGGFGDTFTPALGTKLVGWGTSKNFKSSFDYAFRVVLHPIRLGASKLEDLTFWKSVPLVESINYSGTDLKAVSCTFNALVDDNKPNEISICAVGDSTQYML